MCSILKCGSRWCQGPGLPCSVQALGSWPFLMAGGRHPWCSSRKTPQKSLENVMFIIPSISLVSPFQVKSARDVFKVQGMLLLLALNTSLKDFWKCWFRRGHPVLQPYVEPQLHPVTNEAKFWKKCKDDKHVEKIGQLPKCGNWSATIGT